MSTLLFQSIHVSSPASDGAWRRNRKVKSLLLMSAYDPSDPDIFPYLRKCFLVQLLRANAINPFNLEA
jgi:hypothetical protein